MNRLNGINLSKLLTEPLSKRINQKVIEEWAANLWRQARVRPVSDQRSRKPFVIMFPPPNITGNLHLGHALTGAIQDALVRQKRMQGFDCLFIPGFDHAGLATQNIVERQLMKNQGITRQQLGREKFTELANKWKDKKRDEMRAQLNRLGLDLNADREYFTMDDNSSLAVQAAFKQLFKSGLIYRSTKPIFWSEQLKTTLSDIEVEQVDGVNRYSRTGEIVEKRQLSQWFINATSMARRAVEVVQDGSIDILPSNYKKSWSSWLTENGVQDWCISRQSWWGHKIPAYRKVEHKDLTENWVVADNLDEAKSTLATSDDVIQDSDVLDTWFSSSLLPLTISGWPNEEKFLESCESQHFPLHVMETGFDILTFWVSKMVMISLALTNKIPFKLIILHGMICDSQGKKMSKSRGNVIDPLDVIDGASLQVLLQRTKDSLAQGILDESSLSSVMENQKRLFPQGMPACGADGLRSYLLSHDFQEEVIRVQIQQIDRIHRLSNKIWNVYRYVFQIMDQLKTKGIEEALVLDVLSINNSRLDRDDQQVLSQMAKCVLLANETFNKTYSLHTCFNELESFFVVDLSKDYLQQAKQTLQDPKVDLAERKHKLDVISTCALTSTKLLHPFMPHLSEFLYQKLMVQKTFSGNKLGDQNGKLPLATVLLSYEKFPEPGDWQPFTINEAEYARK